MSGKVRVPQYGKPQGFHTIDDPHATRGATIGVNVWNRDGSLFEPGAIATPVAGQASGVVIWQRVMQIPANVVSAAAIATAGFVRRDGAGDWSASAIVNADLSSADTGGLNEGTNLYFTNFRADARVAIHADRDDNPHGVTAAQVGADPAGTAATAVTDYVTSLATLPDAADDTAAAAASVPVGGQYRTGSILKVRIS